MFEATTMLFIYAETPLHVGSGRGLGAVDLPIQRERITNYPMIQASSLKGSLRAAFREKKYENDDNHPELLTIFGSAEDDGDGADETTNASTGYAGALSVGDARLLLFPVRSLAGVFAWTTSINALERFRRDASRVGLDMNWNLSAFSTSKEQKQNDSENEEESHAFVNGNALLAGGHIVLEEFSFTPIQNDEVKKIGQWLAERALLETGYDYWRRQLPQKLCILPDNVFRDFVQFATEVQTHIRIDPATKTVKSGALWTTESLPLDSLLYAPLLATPSRSPNREKLSGQAVLELLKSLGLDRTQLGGDETTGQGHVALRLQGGLIQ